MKATFLLVALVLFLTHGHGHGLNFIPSGTVSHKELFSNYIKDFNVTVKAEEHAERIYLYIVFY